VFIGGTLLLMLVVGVPWRSIGRRRVGLLAIIGALGAVSGLLAYAWLWPTSIEGWTVDPNTPEPFGGGTWAVVTIAASPTLAALLAIAGATVGVLLGSWTVAKPADATRATVGGS